MLLGVLGTQELMIIFALVLLVILVIRIAKKSALKKFFGILFLVVGLIMVGLGSAALTELSSRNNSFEGRIRDSFNSQYHSENEDQKTIGIVLIAGGSVFFIIGVMM